MAAMVATRPGQQLGDAVFQQFAVGQAGQAVVQRAFQVVLAFEIELGLVDEELAPLLRRG